MVTAREAASLFDGDDHALGLVDRASWSVSRNGLELVKSATAIRANPTPEVAA